MTASAPDDRPEAPRWPDQTDGTLHSSGDLASAEGPTADPPVALLVDAPVWHFPGPGLLESLAWVVGVLLVHVIGGVVALGVLLLRSELPQSIEDPVAFVLDFAASLGPQDLFLLMAIEQAIFVAAVVAAVAFRLRAGRSGGALSFRPIPLGHVVLLAALVFPVMVVSSQLAQLAADKSSDGSNDAIDVVEQIGELAGEIPLAPLLLAVAVAPALGEEIVFRGLIGRGLVARWGFSAGVLLTSFLFAVVHMEPLHVLSVLPLGVVIHIVHLATRSFWAPVLYHFLNNGLAVVLLHAARTVDGGREAAATTASTTDVPLYIVAAAAVCAFFLLTLLWKTRVQFQFPDGTLWDPGYPTAERPAHDLPATPHCRRTSGWVIAAALLGVVLFLAALAQFSAAQA